MKKNISLFLCIMVAIVLYAVEWKTFTSTASYFPFTFKYPPAWGIAYDSTATVPVITLTKTNALITVSPGWYHKDFLPIKDHTRAHWVAQMLVQEFKKQVTVNERLEDAIVLVNINGINAYYTDLDYTNSDGKPCYRRLWVFFQPEFYYVITADLFQSDNMTYYEIGEMAKTFAVKK